MEWHVIRCGCGMCGGVGHVLPGFIQVTTTEYVDPGEDQFSVVISCREGRNLWIQLSLVRGEGTGSREGQRGKIVGILW